MCLNLSGTRVVSSAGFIGNTMESNTELDAKNQHVAMIDKEMLAFDMQYVQFEIADLCHDTNWLEKKHLKACVERGEGMQIGRGGA